MAACELCPRVCGVDRDAGQRGRCHETAEVRIARASLHLWEEPCISGEAGSGTVFFTGCPLGCVFCQNYNIAKGTRGEVISIAELAEIFLKLQEMGANNLNLVTPTHFIPQIKAALERVKTQDWRLPVVYNTSGYERVDALKQLDGLVDIYLPDFKYRSSKLAEKYSFAPDYFPVAKEALAEMVRQVGTPAFGTAPTGEKDMMQRGVIVRHLLLPGCVRDSKRVVKYLWETYGDDIFMSLMCQYTPLSQVETRYPELFCKVTQEEYDELIDYAVDLGITKAFTQEAESASESFIPDFEQFQVKEFLKN